MIGDPANIVDTEEEKLEPMFGHCCTLSNIMLSCEIQFMRLQPQIITAFGNKTASDVTGTLINKSVGQTGIEETHHCFSKQHTIDDTIVLVLRPATKEEIFVSILLIAAHGRIMLILWYPLKTKLTM